MRGMDNILVSRDAPQSLEIYANLAHLYGAAVVWPVNIYMSEVAPHDCIWRQRGMEIERCSSARQVGGQQELMGKK